MILHEFLIMIDSEARRTRHKEGRFVINMCCSHMESDTQHQAKRKLHTELHFLWCPCLHVGGSYRHDQPRSFTTFIIIWSMVIQIKIS